VSEEGSDGDNLLSEFVDIEQHLFQLLGLHFRFAASSENS